jgi:arylsulfatase A-like enzyme
MDAMPPQVPRVNPTRPAVHSRGSMVLLAIAFGLCAGYLDVGILVFKKYCWNSEGYFRNASDFPWTVPLGHAFLMLFPGVVVGLLSRRWPRLISLRLASWFFATLSIWMALLRMPMYGSCSLLLALGLGRAIADMVAAYGERPSARRWILAGLVGVLVVFAAGTSGWQAVREYRTVAGLPAAPAKAHNVVLIVWDTVRAYSLSAYGYKRNTTPYLEQWARTGVKYDLAVSPAPWTYPSHSCFFTGQWPFRLDSQWKFKLDTPAPTLAEYLATQGYQTAGFAANTNCCSYETGLNRGFAHFADYALKPRSILTRTVSGKWVLDQLMSVCGYYYERKWDALQSGDAREITDDFLGWLGRRRPDRPFFAFLNYFDAHEPYIPPPDFSGSFGIPPRTARDNQFLIDYVGAFKNLIPTRDLVMAHDCYDDCVAGLDAQLGRLLDVLKRRGLLADTEVIITSDHGEAFGLHGTMLHSQTVTLEETGVPLVILSPTAPAGRVVKHPVTLRDLPATVVDLLGMPSSPFPGHSLAAYWKQSAGQTSPDLASPAFSERASELAFQKQPENGRKHEGVEMSMVTSGYQYIRNGHGVEHLFDLSLDPYEYGDVIDSTSGQAKLPMLRKMLLDVLSSQPGSSEVENAYLGGYRSWLEELVRAGPTQSLASGGVQSKSIGR